MFSEYARSSKPPAAAPDRADDADDVLWRDDDPKPYANLIAAARTQRSARPAVVATTSSSSSILNTWIPTNRKPAPPSKPTRRKRRANHDEDSASSSSVQSRNSLDGFIVNDDNEDCNHNNERARSPPVRRAAATAARAKFVSLSSANDDSAINLVTEDDETPARPKAKAVARKIRAVSLSSSDEAPRKKHRRRLVALSSSSSEEEDEPQDALSQCETMSRRLRASLEAPAPQANEQQLLLTQAQADELVSPGALKPYQVSGLNWLGLLHGMDLNGVLADEMGLGKTVQALAFIRLLQRREGVSGPHLVVAPASVAENWRREAAKWLPDLKAVVYAGSQAERDEIRRSWNELGVDVCIATYTLFDKDSNKVDRAFLYKQDFVLAVFDEAHALKNPRNSRYSRLLKIKSRRRLLLSGTPVQNKLDELLALLAFCCPNIFTRDGLDLALAADENPQRFRRILAPFVLRRVKADVLTHLQPKTEQIVMLDMLPGQKVQYEALFRSLAQSKSSFSSKFTELRKVANHPLLGRARYSPQDMDEVVRIVFASDWFGSEASLEQVRKHMADMSDFELSATLGDIGSDRALAKVLPSELMAESAKAAFLVHNLPKLVQEGHFVILFSQWTLILDVLERLLADVLGLGFLRLDGATPVNERQQLVDAFNDGTAPVFLLSTRAGGLGLNLTKADTVILHDLDWSMSNDSQAEDRAHRIGQLRPVTVIKLVCKDSVDEGIFRVAESKRGLEKVAESDLSARHGELLLPKVPELLGVDEGGAPKEEDWAERAWRLEEQRVIVDLSGA